MANTTNFGWETPDDTDLVKDGAAAMRTLGNAIDASFVDLKGGTTGQILSKNSNTDLDYTWINNDQGDITEVIAGTGMSGGGSSGSVTLTNTVATAFDSAGDIVYGTGADTFTKLSLGTAGQILTVNSGATAPEWKTPAGGGKVLQVVSANTSSEVTISSESDTDSGITATITPSATNSKILVIVTTHIQLNRGATGDSDNEQGCKVKLLRGATVVVDNGNVSAITMRNQDTAITSTFNYSMTYLDSPNTTSPTTYKIQGARQTGNQSGTVTFQLQSRDSAIVLMEIGA